MRKAPRGAFVLLALAVTLLGPAAAEDHRADEGGDHDHDELAGVRLLVAALDAPELAVLDAASGALIGRFTTPGVGRVHQLPDPRHAAVVHRDADRVSFVHSGLSAIDHGDHMDLLQGPPYVLSTVNVGRQPAHLFAHGHDLAIFRDADGGVAWLDARLLGISLDFVEIPGEAPGPGASAVVNGHLVAGSTETGRASVYDHGRALLASLDGCPGLHGQAVLGDAVAFGCADGVLVVEVRLDEAPASYRIANPAAAAGARVGSLTADPGSPVIAGTSGEGVVLIDLEARSVAAIAAPAFPAAIRFAGEGEVLLVLTVDGVLHALDPATGELGDGGRVTGAVAAGAPHPSLAVLGGHAFVADPATNEVVVVRADDLEVEARYALPFAPGGIAVMAIPGARLHRRRRRGLKAPRARRRRAAPSA